MYTTFDICGCDSRCTECDADFGSVVSLEVHKFESSHWSDADGGGPWTDVSRDCMDDEPDFGEEFANKNQLEIESELLLL